MILSILMKRIMNKTEYQTEQKLYPLHFQMACGS